MGDNRTVPSQPPVVDGKNRPPAQVLVAVRLAAINYALGLTIIVVFWEYFSTLQSAESLIWNQAFSLVLFVWIYYKIYFGRNWARITLLALGGLLVLISTSCVLSDKFMELVAPAPTMVKVHMMVAPLITLAILWLLFMSTGRHWFRKDRAGVPPYTSFERTREG